MAITFRKCFLTETKKQPSPWMDYRNLSQVGFESFLSNGKQHLTSSWWGRDGKDTCILFLLLVRRMCLTNHPSVLSVISGISPTQLQMVSKQSKDVVLDVSLFNTPCLCRSVKDKEATAAGEATHSFFLQSETRWWESGVLKRGIPSYALRRQGSIWCSLWTIFIRRDVMAQQSLYSPVKSVFEKSAFSLNKGSELKRLPVTTTRAPSPVTSLPAN